MKKIDAKIFEYRAELNIDDNLTLINGDSGIGKTLIFNYLDRCSYDNDKIKCFNAKYLEKIKLDGKSVQRALENRLKLIKKSLIVIDNAEIILDDRLRRYIAFDGDNTYMIFGRNVSGLWITENNIATLVRDTKNKRMYLDYYFKDVNSIDRTLDGR